MHVGSEPAGRLWEAARFIKAFRHRLRELDSLDGKTFVLDVRYTEARVERLSELARELVALKG